MIIDNTTDTLQVVLSGTVTTRQIDFFSSYNIISSTGLTPTKLVGTTNNLVPVTIVPSPSTNQQHQLRHLSVFNCDSDPEITIIQLSGSSGTRRLFSSYLFAGDSIQYTPTNGWQVYNYNGVLKTSNTPVNPTPTRHIPFFNAINLTGVQTLTSGTNFAFYLGKADRAFNQISVQYNITTALGATITWAELAIYKGIPNISSNTTTMTLCGFRDVNASTGQSGFAATGVKNSYIRVSNIAAGDDLWVVFGSVTTGTNAVIRAGLPDSLAAGFVQTATGSLRPSTNNRITFTAQSNVNMGYITWQGFQW